MQVRTPAQQHAVMIEAVENHMPQVIVIDEIGTELEAAAARTIAERGVQLIGTAHGNNLDNLMLNPTLSDLIGGIQSVTLGDEEARRRRSQKSVLERKAPPTFDVVVEIQSRDRVTVHPDVAETVDAMLRGDPDRGRVALSRRRRSGPAIAGTAAAGPAVADARRAVRRPGWHRLRRLARGARLATWNTHVADVVQQLNSGCSSPSAAIGRATARARAAVGAAAERLEPQAPALRPRHGRMIDDRRKRSRPGK